METKQIWEVFYQIPIQRIVVWRGERSTLARNLEFFWLLLKGRIQVAKQLKKVKWAGSPMCKLCGEEEDVNHLMFKCAPAQFMWCCFRDALNWETIPRSSIELINVRHKTEPALKMPLLYLFFCAGCWALWRVRNDWVFNNKLVADIMHLPYKAISFFLQWKNLVSMKMRGELETLRTSLHASTQEAGRIR